MCLTRKKPSNIRFSLRQPIIFIVTVYCLSTAALAQKQPTLRGMVTDASTGEALVAANIRLLGTSRGTITNSEGSYFLSLDSNSYEIVVSYLGYQPDTLSVALKVSEIRNVALKPSPIKLPELLVLAEDPALEIIRKAIAHKHEWMGRLKSYSFEAYTRQVLMRDSSIASVMEAYTEGFQKVGDALREVMKQKRETKNIPSGENFASVQRIVNFNEDRINLFSMNVNTSSSSYTFVGPTASDALDNYDYKLLKTSWMSGHEIYYIRMTPKSRIRPLFSGEVTIADGTFAVMGVDVRPNESFTIPFVNNIDLRYQQQFALYDSVFWMPVDVRIKGGFSISLIGLSLPRIGIDLVSSIYRYTINPAIPDSVLQKPRLTVDSSASKYDSTFWQANVVLPLTPEEEHAYTTLDSSQTLEKQFEPKGPLASLGGQGTETTLGMLDARFNRVEGFFLGGKKEVDSISNYMKLNVAAGFGFSDQRFKYLVGATVFPVGNKAIGLGGEYYSKLNNVPDDGFYGPFIISLMAIIDKNDYRDYYLAKGGRVFVSADPARWLSSTLSFVAEQQYSLDAETQYSLFTQSDSYRPNPKIHDGKFRSLRLDLRLGDEEIPLDIISRDAFEFSVEHSSPRIAKSEFDFTRYHGVLTMSVKTFDRDLLFSPTIRFRLSGGLGVGTLPAQQIFTPDSRSSGYAPFGVLRGETIKEFSGDRFIMLNVEHNFRSIPFLLLNIPSFYRSGIELIVHCSFAQTWTGSLSTSNGWYSEAGIGVSRVLDLLRFDLTYRFKEPKRLFLSASIATLF